MVKAKDVPGWLEYAAATAHRSTIKSFHTGAVLVNRGTLVSAGCSHYSSLRLVRYRSIHAEMHALMRANPEECVGADAFVATVRCKSGRIGLGKPCAFCLTLLDEAGIRRIFYTVEGDRWSHITL